MKENYQREPIEIPNNNSFSMFGSNHSAKPFSLANSFQPSRNLLFDASRNFQGSIGSGSMPSIFHGDPFTKDQSESDKSSTSSPEKEFRKNLEKHFPDIPGDFGRNSLFHSNFRQSIERELSAMSNFPFSNSSFFTPKKEKQAMDIQEPQAMDIQEPQEQQQQPTTPDSKIEQEPVDQSSPKKEEEQEKEMEREEENLTQCYSSGIPNLGNTCFMNSVLQCLMNTYMYDYLVQGKHLLGNSEEKPITESFAELLCHAFSKGAGRERIKRSVYRLKKNLEKVNPTFEGYQQNDAHEFFRALIEKMHSEMNSAHKRLEPSSEFTPSRRATTLPLKAREWREYSKQRDHSIMTRMFGGELLSEVVCKNCHYTSHTFEDALDLSLNLPLSNANSSSNEEFATSLITCLDEFVKEEEIEGYRCENCECKDTSVKRTTIWKAPEVLVIHLKRFVYNQDGELDTRKNRVSFPLDNLDIQYFMHEDSRENPHRYELSSVVDHFGDLNCGHYISYVKNEDVGCWLEYNDHHVYKVQDESMRRHAAGSAESYILFYKRK